MLAEACGLGQRRAAMFAGDKRLANLTAVVDVNRTQADGDLVLGR